MPDFLHTDSTIDEILEKEKQMLVSSRKSPEVIPAICVKLQADITTQNRLNRV